MQLTALALQCDLCDEWRPTALFASLPFRRGGGYAWCRAAITRANRSQGARSSKAVLEGLAKSGDQSICDGYRNAVLVYEQGGENAVAPLVSHEPNPSMPETLVGDDGAMRWRPRE